MAHEVESMMYVGDEPWHGLGNAILGKELSIEEAIVAAGLNWEEIKISILRTELEYTVIMPPIANQTILFSAL